MHVFRKWFVRHGRVSVIYISAIVLALDVVFVVINYYSNKATLNAGLLQNAVEQQREFGLTLQMTYRNMMQMALYISQNDELNQLFLQGKQAVEREGGGKGGKEANAARQALLKKVKPAWDKLTQAFDIRQLHYHLGPGSLSFLRVHKSQKYGDRMDDLRFIIVDTNAEKTSRYGFETGRIYSGLRGVYPIWAVDPKTKQNVYVGALETGTSFKQILPQFARFFNTNIAVLLTKQHIESKMWPEFIKQYFAKNPDVNYYIESTSSNNVKHILSHITIDPSFSLDHVVIYQQGSIYWSVYYFPLRDYRGGIISTEPNAGFVLIWSDATALIHEFKRNVVVNSIYAFIAFIIVEITLLAFFGRERRLIEAEKSANIDGLTSISNRSHFNSIYNNEFVTAKKARQPFSLIMCDVDFFKQYNDTYGHQAGDDCLRDVAMTINSFIKRGSDFLARYGGEEFIIILRDTPLDAAKKIADDICKAIEALKRQHKNSDVSEYVTISMGVASSENCDNSDCLLKKADENLYAAKHSGRNQVIAKK